MEYESTRNELYHYGVRGMRWGVRRYQNDDGSLTKAGQKHYSKEMEKLKAEKKKLTNEARTKKKMEKLNKMKSDVDKLKKGEKDNDAQKETTEQKKERLLKSTNPKEIYEGRSLLSTQELNDRINRIDMETRLQGKIVEEHKKNGLDYINDKMQSSKRTIDNATGLYRSVDSAYSSVSNSAIGKILAKKLGLEPPKKEFNLDKFWNNRNKKTTQEMLDTYKRIMAEQNIEKYMNQR